MSHPILIAAGQGEHLWYDGGVLTFKATSAQTGGALLFFEIWMPRGKATPLHVHPEADESFYLIEGEIRVHAEGQEDRTASSGAFVSIPRGTPHAFAVVSESVRMVVLFTPASTVSEEFFRLAGELATDLSLAPPLANLERFQGAVARSGLQVLGPPPFPELVSQPVA